MNVNVLARTVHKCVCARVCPHFAVWKSLSQQVAMNTSFLYQCTLGIAAASHTNTKMHKHAGEWSSVMRQILVIYSGQYASTHFSHLWCFQTSQKKTEALSKAQWTIFLYILISTCYVKQNEVWLVEVQKGTKTTFCSVHTGSDNLACLDFNWKVTWSNDLMTNSWRKKICHFTIGFDNGNLNFYWFGRKSDVLRQTKLKWL